MNAPRKAILYRMVMPQHVCPFGLKTKDLLRRHGFEVEDRWLESRAETDAFKAQHKVETTPQTFIDGVRIGGYDDVRAWLVALAASAIGRPRRLPPQGRFNAGQKLNALYVAGLGVGLTITGGLIWPDWLLGPAPRAFVFGLHDLLMLLSLPALALHLLLTLVFPPTRPSLRGMLTGRVRADWRDCEIGLPQRTPHRRGHLPGIVA